MVNVPLHYRFTFSGSYSVMYLLITEQLAYGKPIESGPCTNPVAGRSGISPLWICQKKIKVKNIKISEPITTDQFISYAAVGSLGSNPDYVGYAVLCGCLGSLYVIWFTPTVQRQAVLVDQSL